LIPASACILCSSSLRLNEVEEVCFGDALVQRAKASGNNPIYYVLGQTVAGRHLFCVVIQFPDGKGFPITARPMTDAAKPQLGNSLLVTIKDYELIWSEGPEASRVFEQSSRLQKHMFVETSSTEDLRQIIRRGTVRPRALHASFKLG
jgi:hypothetical protein